MLLLLAGIHFAQHPENKALTSGGSRPSDNGGGGRGGGAIQTLRWEGGDGPQKNFFSALRDLVWSKDKGRFGPLPWIRNC